LCQCGPSACVLPDLVAHSAPQCDQGDTTPYPAPAGWDGSCITSGVVPDADVASISFPPLTQAPCVPSEGEELQSVAFGWATIAIACRDDETYAPWNCDEGLICVISDEDDHTQDFHQCIYKEGDFGPCPLGYPERRVFYQGADSSSMSCTPCGCDPPEGGACEAEVNAHPGDACAGDTTPATVGLIEPECQAIPAGADVRSMSATWIQNQPGSCTPTGSAPLGDPSLIGPATFCCQNK
ncbi:MAG TPA: hypothetical protein VLS89_15125, partial [Candidatus Nanopelagicales bacterium]|nr:hypothetical protein [Candidatus Nanopelagicales bacterium]